MASCLFVVLRGEDGRVARVRAYYVYSAIAFFAVTLSFLRWMVGGDGVRRRSTAVKKSGTFSNSTAVV